MNKKTTPHTIKTNQIFNLFLIIFKLIFLVIFSLITLKAMEQENTCESLTAEQIIHAACQRTFDLNLNSETATITKPSEYIFERLLILCPNAFGQAMPCTPPEFQNAFRKKISTIIKNNLPEIIITKINGGTFDDWFDNITHQYIHKIITLALLNSYKKLSNIVEKKILNSEEQPGLFDQWFNKIRNKKIRSLTLKTAVNFIKECIKMAKISYCTNHHIEELKKSFNNQPPNSILKIIFAFLLYKEMGIHFLPEDNLVSRIKNNFIKMINDAFDNGMVNYALIFNPTPILPLRKILELAPHLYDEPITSLDLSCNNLKTLPETIDCLSNLEKLNLYHNALKNLPYTISQLPKLKKLIIDIKLFKNISNDFLKKSGEKTKIIAKDEKQCFIYP